MGNCVYTKIKEIMVSLMKAQGLRIHPGFLAVFAVGSDGKLCFTCSVSSCCRFMARGLRRRELCLRGRTSFAACSRCKCGRALSSLNSPPGILAVSAIGSGGSFILLVSLACAAGPCAHSIRRAMRVACCTGTVDINIYCWVGHTGIIRGVAFRSVVS